MVQGIISELRVADLISNTEQSNLGFTAVHFLKEEPYVLKPLVLPICFFAGKIQQALDSGSIDPASFEVPLPAVCARYTPVCAPYNRAQLTPLATLHICTWGLATQKPFPEHS